MLGLIKQLAKLITIAKNLPKIPRLVTQLTKPQDIALTLAMGVAGDELEQMKNKAEENLNDITRSIDDRAQERIREVRNSNATDKDKEREITRITEERTQQINQLRSASVEDIKLAVEQKVSERAKAMEPAIQAALSPLLALIGIPSAVVYMIDKISAASKATDVLSSLGSNVKTPNVSVQNPGVSSAAQSEALFNASINSIEGSSGPPWPIGSTDDSIEVVKVFSEVKSPEFKYENGVPVRELNLVTEKVLNRTFILKEFGDNFPSDQKNRVSYSMDSEGRIKISWNYVSTNTNLSNPKFDNFIVFEVTGVKAFPLTRASNTFVIPILFESTFPEQQ